MQLSRKKIYQAFVVCALAAFFFPFQEARAERFRQLVRAQSTLLVFPTDIFINDSETRKAATNEQVRWTVSLGGCSGSMLTPRYLLTANHCNPRTGARYTSGACLATGCSRDLRALRVVERDAQFDYAIVEVEFTQESSKWEQRYTPQIQISDEQIRTGRDGEGTALFTVGFPGDKNRAMHATGYAKRQTQSRLFYNVGIINGNSGGAMWTQDDYILVSLTNGGPNNLGEPGWNNGRPEDPQDWNFGANISNARAQSRLLRNLFDSQGINQRTSWDGRLLFDN